MSPSIRVLRTAQDYADATACYGRLLTVTPEAYRNGYTLRVENGEPWTSPYYGVRYEQGKFRMIGIDTRGNVVVVDPTLIDEERDELNRTSQALERRRLSRPALGSR